MVEQLIVACTPLIVLAIGELVKWIKESIKGIWLLVIVGSSSAIIAWITQLIANPNLGSFEQFLYGLLAVVIHQFFKQLNSGN